MHIHHARPRRRLAKLPPAFLLPALNSPGRPGPGRRTRHHAAEMTARTCALRRPPAPLAPAATPRPAASGLQRLPRRPLHHGSRPAASSTSRAGRCSAPGRGTLRPRLDWPGGPGPTQHQHSCCSRPGCPDGRLALLVASPALATPPMACAGAGSARGRRRPAGAAARCTTARRPRSRLCGTALPPITAPARAAPPRQSPPCRAPPPRTARRTIPSGRSAPARTAAAAALHARRWPNSPP